MTSVELKAQLEYLVPESKIQESIDLLWEWVRRESLWWRDVADCKGMWTDVEMDYANNRINSSERQQQRTRIRSNLLDLVKKLKDSDVKDDTSHKIATRLLVITPTKATIEEMQAFFPFEYFRDTVFVYDDRYDVKGDDEDENLKNIGIHIWMNESYREEIADSDLVVFDNFEHKRITVDEQRRNLQTEKLKWVLTNTECFIVWFGNYDQIVNQHNDRIYAANSRFSLYARILEMLDFLKIYRNYSLI